MKKAPRSWKEANLLEKIGFIISIVMVVIAVIAVARQKTSSTVINIQLGLFALMTTCFVLARVQRIKKWLEGPKTMEKIQPRLQKLETEIKEIETMDNKVEAIVKLFQVISPLQDSGGFSQEIFELNKRNRRGKHDAQIEALGILQVHFNRSGRSPYGMNRTAEGEEVRAEKVFLGNVHGLWTNPASYWLSKRSELEQAFRSDVVLTPGKPASEWDIINDYQCGKFIKSHTDGILEQIKVLKVA